MHANLNLSEGNRTFEVKFDRRSAQGTRACSATAACNVMAEDAPAGCTTEGAIYTQSLEMNRPLEALQAEFKSQQALVELVEDLQAELEREFAGIWDIGRRHQEAEGAQLAYYGCCGQENQARADSSEGTK